MLVGYEGSYKPNRYDSALRNPNKAYFGGVIKNTNDVLKT